MAEKLPPERFWELYKNLPQELKNVLFAEETGNYVYEICEKNEIKEKMGQIVDYVGQVLIGVLPPENFQKTLEKEVELPSETAKKVTQEIHRLIFYPVKPCLEELYRVEITGAPVSSKPETPPPAEEKPSVPPGKDVYRETVE